MNIHEEELRIKLRTVCSSDGQYVDALEKCHSSMWDLKTMMDFIACTGKTPPNSLLSYPEETMILVRSGMLGA